MAEEEKNEFENVAGDLSSEDEENVQEHLNSTAGDAGDKDNTDDIKEKGENAKNSDALSETDDDRVGSNSGDIISGRGETPVAVGRKNTKKEKSQRSRSVKIAVGSFCAAVGIGVLAFCVYGGTYSRIMPNTYIEDINLGGMTQAEAAEALTSEYNESKLEGQTMTFNCMGDSSEILIDNLAISFEPEKMASSAYTSGRENNSFFTKLKSFVNGLISGEKLEPELSYDEQALTGAISDLCSPHEKEPLGYTFRLGDNNNIIIAKPQDGIKVNMDEAVDNVLDRICTFTFGNVTFEPVVTEAEEIDVDAFYNYITAPAIDASYAKDENNSVYVVPAKPQIVVSKAAIEEALSKPDEEYSVPVQLVEPAVNGEYLQKIMYEDTLGSYTTDYSSSSAARASNIRLASNTISGLELLPGERFDFNGIVGERTPDRGYQQAPVYVVKNGQTVSEVDYGGGICQVSSTIFCAVYRADLDVISRTSHSKDVSYVPKGMDATVSWGGPEFIFENSTEYPIRIFVEASGGTLTCRIVGSNVGELPQSNMEVQNDGNDIIVTRTVTNDDGSEVQEVISSKNPPVATIAPLPSQEAEITMDPTAD